MHIVPLRLICVTFAHWIVARWRGAVDNDGTTSGSSRLVVFPSMMSEAANKENTAKRVGSYQQPFVEKYRPRTLDDVEGNEETILRLRAIGKDGNMPNLILAGPPGTGSKWIHGDGAITPAMTGAAVESVDLRHHQSETVLRP